MKLHIKIKYKLHEKFINFDFYVMKKINLKCYYNEKFKKIIKKRVKSN